MVLDPLDLRLLRQLVFQLAFPASRVFAGTVAADCGPIEYALNPAADPARRLRLGCVSFRACDRLRFGRPASRSGRLLDAARYRGSAHVLPTPCCRGNMLAHAGSAAQEVSELVVAAAISPRRSSALQSKHRSTSALDAAVILLKSVVQIATCPMPHMAAEFCPDCPGIGIVAVRGDPIRGYAGHRLCRSKEGLGGGKVAVLTQHHVDQGASAIDRSPTVPVLSPCRVRRNCASGSTQPRMASRVWEALNWKCSDTTRPGPGLFNEPLIR